RIARGVDDDFSADLLRAPRLAGDHDAIRRGQSFARDAQIFGRPAEFRAKAEIGVHHLVRDAVADFVRVAFANGFAGKEVARTLHLLPSRWWAASYKVSIG